MDPPTVKTFCGVPRLFRETEAFEKALNLHLNDAHGLKLYLGCFAEMGENIPAIIE